MNRSLQKAPTMQDVATRAGVTRVTASAVMNGKMFGTRVSEETRRRVLQAAKDLRYTRNEIANALKSGKTNSIGFYDVYNSITLSNEFISGLLTGILDKCTEIGKDLLVHGVSSSLDDPNFRSFLSGKADGLILLSRQDHPVVDYLASSYLPVVAVTDTLPTFPSVVVDDYSGGKIQAEFLAGRRRSRTLYLHHPQRHASAEKRFQGFIKTAQQGGLEIIVSDLDNIDRLQERHIAFLERCRHEPGNVVGWNDSATWAAAAYCRDRALRIPEDVALIGFDGFRNAELFPHTLTSIVAPWAEVGKAAADLLVAQISGHEVPRETVIPVALRVGTTT